MPYGPDTITGYRQSCDITPQTTRQNNGTSNYPCTEVGKTGSLRAKMDLTQLPVIVNHATTVHKLQGKTMERLVIAEWWTGKN